MRNRRALANCPRDARASARCRRALPRWRSPGRRRQRRYRRVRPSPRDGVWRAAFRVRRSAASSASVSASPWTSTAMDAPTSPPARVSRSTMAGKRVASTSGPARPAPSSELGRPGGTGRALRSLGAPDPRPRQGWARGRDHRRAESGRRRACIKVFSPPARRRPARELWHRNGPPLATLGWDLALAGDQNGDGRGDLFVGQPTAGGGRGASRERQGRRRAADVRSNEAISSFGWYVARLDDLDGDRRADLAVGAQPGNGPDDPPGGRAYASRRQAGRSSSSGRAPTLCSASARSWPRSATSTATAAVKSS